MASKGQKFASYSLEFKNEVLEAYKSANMAVEIKLQNITILVQQQFGIGFQKIENKVLQKMIFIVREVELKNQI